MAKKFGLGRGLGSLIPDKDKSASGVNYLGNDDQSDVDANQKGAELKINNKIQKIDYIDPSKIITSHFQPRQIFEHTALEELVNSIKEYGILEPLIVSPLEEGRYRLVAGERRLRAAKIINLPTVPVIIRTVSEQQRLEISLIENIQRKDLNPMEEAGAYQKLIDEFGITQEEVSMQVGRSRSKIANSLRLLNLNPEIQKLVAGGRITEGHAKVILEVKDPKEQMKIIEKILGQKLSVRDTEKVIKIKRGLVPSNLISDKILQTQQELSQHLKTKVEIKPKRKGGVIEIAYYSNEELNNLVDKLK